MKFCSNCVIPETDESITFDENNQCSVCQQSKIKHEKINWNEREKKLDILLDKIRGKNEYDCIVPFSGGKDSVFTLWYLIKKKKLNPLVVRFDHNFLRDEVLKNTEKTLINLGCDFYNYKPNFDIVKKIMLETFIRRGDFCWHCHVGITAFPINVAIEKKIPLLIYGESSVEYSSWYKFDDFEELNTEKFNRFTNLGINAEDLVGMINERHPNEKISISDLKQFIFPTKLELLRNKIKATYLGNYIPWDVRKQVKIIKKELDWKGAQVEGIPEEYDYEKIECFMQGTRDYIKFLKRGFGRTSHLTSIDIRHGRKTREGAINLVKEYDGKKPKSLDFLCKILKISEDEFYNIVLKHVVYPNKMPELENLKNNKYNNFPEDFSSFEDKIS